MKKYIIILIFIGALALLYQFFVTLFISSHTQTYSIKTKDNHYDIVEDFVQRGDDSIYHFSVVDQNNHTYTFSYTHDFNKQDQIIRDIRYFKKGNLECIFPIYKRGLFSDVSCIYQDMQVSYSYLVQIQNQDISFIIKQLEKKNYSSLGWKVSLVADKEDNLSIYKKNLFQDYIFTVWFYKGFYLIDQDDVLKKEILDRDSYDNIYSILSDQYYVIANTDEFSNNQGISSFYIYNIKDKGKSKIDFDFHLSKDFYFNGTYQGWVYFTDLDSQLEYRLQPSSLKVEEIGNESLGYQVVKNNQLKKISQREFFKEKIYFESYVENSKLEKKFGTNQIYEDDDFYYYQLKDGRVYRVSREHLDYPVLLFQFPNIVDWKIKDGSIMVVSGDTMYLYSDDLGLRPIVKDPELPYNYKNICNFIKK